MNEWPTAWKELLLEHSGIEISQHALDVLRDWHLSTPTQPWTNNPLGLPALGNNVPEAMGTPYGAFPTHASFRIAFKKLVDAGGHMPISHALQDGTSIAKAWRTINGLYLPGRDTETDYPAVLLDRADERYRAKVQTAQPVERKTMGEGPKGIDLHHPVIQATRALHASNADMKNLGKAFESIIRRIG